jgi:molybdate-binding protein/DNA-binding XRE family transcriptional regulator
MPRAPEIENHLAELRRKRGLSAAQLAKMAGVSRQTVYAIEGGSYVPNTALALRLARILETAVEELFALPDDAPAPELPTEWVSLLPGSEAPRAGQPVQLCRVGRQTMAAPPAAIPWYFPASDAIVAGAPGAAGRTRVQVFHPDESWGNRILVAGCDPAISVLARYVQAAGIELVLAHRNSSQSLALLQAGLIHVAGTHLRDESSGESNLPEIGRMFPKRSVAVITFAVWEEGIVTASGNPKGIRGIEDLARPAITIVNREVGAGSRRLLDAQLERLGISNRKIRGYEKEMPGHLTAAWQVRTGAADCCIATRGAARVFGLGFLPLASERYDLAIRRQNLDLPPVQTLLDTLSRSSFRRELESLGGYDAAAAGRRML